MAKLIGTGTNQVPTNGMLGGMAFQTPEDVTVEKIQENDFNVVTQTDIGTAPNQIPLNQFLGGLAYMDSVAGLDFSATSSSPTGTVTSQVLDDYEEGTWTPQVTQGVSGTPTYSNQYGWYVKIGRLVTTYFYIKFGSSGNTGSNSIFQLGNLPFPISSVYQTVYQRGMGVSNYHSIPGFTSANVSFYGGGNSNTFASLYQGQTAVATSSAVNSQYIIGGFEYTSE